MSIILSEHFNLTEFTTSLVASTRRIDNTPPSSRAFSAISGQIYKTPSLIVIIAKFYRDLIFFYRRKCKLIIPREFNRPTPLPLALKKGDGTKKQKVFKIIPLGIIPLGIILYLCREPNIKHYEQDTIRIVVQTGILQRTTPAEILTKPARMYFFRHNLPSHREMLKKPCVIIFVSL